jgi:hypothetical protein
MYNSPIASAYVFMIRLVSALVFALLNSAATAEWVMVNDNDDYIAYADPATISRAGNLVQMRDLIDLKSPRPSPYGNAHESSIAHSEFDCANPRMRTLAFTLHAGRMGNGELVETATKSNGWLPVFPGTLLGLLWQFACGPT